MGGDQEVGGRKTYAETRPEAVAFAKELHAQGVSLRKISAGWHCKAPVADPISPPQCNLCRDSQAAPLTAIFAYISPMVWLSSRAFSSDTGRIT